jgi:hypothetical protein
MIRSLTLAATLLGTAAVATLACSDDDAPSAPTAGPSFKHASAPTLTPQQSGTTSRLQAISPVNAQVAWASGTNGTFVVTTDGGETWRAGVEARAETQEFHDV